MINCLGIKAQRMHSNFIISLGLIFSSSIAGSFHCGAMCGSFSCLACQSSTSTRKSILNQLIYNLGRLISYLILTTFFYLGISSAGLKLDSNTIKNITAFTCILFLLLDLILQFKIFNKILLKYFSANSLQRRLFNLSNQASNIISKLNTSNKNISSFMLGLCTGLIPCGWLYIYIALASTQKNLALAYLTTFSFWSGTIPILFIIGIFGGRIANSIFPRIRYLSRSLLICAALISIQERYPMFGGSDSDCSFCNSNNNQTIQNDNVVKK